MKFTVFDFGFLSSIAVALFFMVMGFQIGAWSMLIIANVYNVGAILSKQLSKKE